MTRSLFRQVFHDCRNHEQNHQENGMMVRTTLITNSIPPICLSLHYESNKILPHIPGQWQDCRFWTVLKCRHDHRWRVFGNPKAPSGFAEKSIYPYLPALQRRQREYPLQNDCGLSQAKLNENEVPIQLQTNAMIFGSNA